MSPSSWEPTPTSRHLRGRRSQDTAPELLLRRALHAAGGRFRLRRSLARGCNPDLVLPSRHLAVWVDGDFWHGCPRHGPTEEQFHGPNRGLWLEKLKQNRERDLRASQIAEELGWTVIRVWECEIRADPDGVAGQLLSYPLVKRRKGPPAGHSPEATPGVSRLTAGRRRAP